MPQASLIPIYPIFPHGGGRREEDEEEASLEASLVKMRSNLHRAGRAREDHRFGFRRANIFRQYQADLGLILAALGAQQRHHPKHFSFALPRSRRS